MDISSQLSNLTTARNTYIDVSSFYHIIPELNMKKIKFLSVLLTVALMVSLVAPASAHAIADVPELKSAAIYLADSQTGYVYYERQSDLQVYPASLTKIMTALLVVEALERGELLLEDEVTAQEGFDFDMDKEGSSANIVVGETLTVRDLLYCILLASANEATNIIATHMYGTIQGFVSKMNERALELGCTNTHFANPHGLPNEDHYTTASDMFKITQEAMQHDIFVTVCDTIETTIPATNKSDVRGLTNTNGLITSASVYKGYYYEPAIGIKTGYTSAAGYCLISSAKSRNINPICIVMGGVMTESINGSLDHSNYSDSIKLYNWIFSNYTRTELVEGESIVLDVPVKLGSNADTISLRAQESVTGVLPNDADLTRLQQDIVIYSEEDNFAVKAPFDEGTVLGEITVSLDGVTYGSTYLVANRSVDLSYAAAMADTVLSTLSNPIVRAMIVVVLLLAICYGMVVFRWRMAKRQREQKLAEERLRRQKLEEQAKREEMMNEARRRSYYSTPNAKRPAMKTSAPTPDSRHFGVGETIDFFDELFPD